MTIQINLSQIGLDDSYEGILNITSSNYNDFDVDFSFNNNGIINLDYDSILVYDKIKQKHLSEAEVKNYFDNHLKKFIETLNLDELIIYDDYLQVHANHTLFKIVNDDFRYDEYKFLVNKALHELKDKLSIEIYCLGRSGRHICIDFSKENILNFENIKKEILLKEKEIINYFNKNETC